MVGRHRWRGGGRGRTGRGLLLTRIIHCSDTHLGHQQFGRVDPASGQNQRERDHADAFRAVVDAALADPPDVFIHAGDLFDGVRPSNRALADAFEAFLALSKAGIPAVAIAGNHEHPKMRETGSPFRLLAHLDGVHAVYRAKAETISIGPELHVHAVPQCIDNAALREQVEALERRPGTNVLVLHGAVHDLPAFQHAEFNELTLDRTWFESFDYVALGHYHGVTEVADNAWYSGAPDRVSIAESGQAKGYLDVTLSPDSAPEVRHRPVAGRPYVDLPIIEATGLDAAGVKQAAIEALGRVEAGAVCRLRVKDVDAGLRGVLDERAIRAAGAGLLHLDLQIAWHDQRLAVQGSWEIGALRDEFEAYAATQPMEGIDRRRLVEAATRLLDEAP